MIAKVFIVESNSVFEYLFVNSLLVTFHRFQQH